METTKNGSLLTNASITIRFVNFKSASTNSLPHMMSQAVVVPTLVTNHVATSSTGITYQVVSVHLLGTFLHRLPAFLASATAAACWAQRRELRRLRKRANRRCSQQKTSWTAAVRCEVMNKPWDVSLSKIDFFVKNIGDDTTCQHISRKLRKWLSAVQALRRPIQRYWVDAPLLISCLWEYACGSKPNFEKIGKLQGSLCWCVHLWWFLVFIQVRTIIIWMLQSDMQQLTLLLGYHSCWIYDDISMVDWVL